VRSEAQSGRRLLRWTGAEEGNLTLFATGMGGAAVRCCAVKAASRAVVGEIEGKDASSARLASASWLSRSALQAAASLCEDDFTRDSAG
jgi:hypothetical protein